MRPRSLVVACLALVTLAGCGDPALWARYRAERALWRARRMVTRIEVRPSLASASDYHRAAALYDRLREQFPAQVWLGSHPPGAPGLATDVARIAGRAAVERARLDERAGRDAEARAGYARAREEFATLPDIAVDAGEAEALALERAGDSTAAIPVWEAVSRGYGPLDARSGEPYQPVLDGALRLAAYHAAAGRGAASESTLAATEARLTAAIHAPGARPVPDDAWLALSDVRAARSDLDGCLDAVREALVHGATAARRPEYVLLLAEHSLEGHRPDSVRTYTRWVTSEFGGLAGLQAMQFEARAWELDGPPDSALAAWSRLLEAYPKAQDATAESRFRRGVILEELGRWELARTEFRALAAAQPAHPLAFEAQLRIVQYAARMGQADVARSEGRKAVENMEHLIATQHDETIQRAARHARAELLATMGEWALACDAFTELWRNGPAEEGSAAAGLRAADIAETQLHDRAHAAALYRELASGAPDPGVRARARAQWTRLQR